LQGFEELVRPSSQITVFAHTQDDTVARTGRLDVCQFPLSR
jgi:hypothetical protein